MKAWFGLAAAIGLLGLPAAQVAAETVYTPMVYRQVSGERPFVPVKLNGQPFLFMVHANASFFAMTTHANARLAGISNLVAKGAYGITEPGKVSDLGSASATVDTFQVDRSITRDMPIQVFEIPQTPPVDGMVGIKWLRQTRVMVDYRRDRLAIPQSDADASEERQRLQREDYVAIPMTWNASANRYVVQAKVNGRTGTFTVSTVSYVILDDRFARDSGMALGPVVGTFGGPKGATGEERETNTSFAIEIDGRRFASPKARSYDIYAYDDDERPSSPEAQMAGYLGCDFMRANGAVIDFGSGTLFLAP